MRTKRCQNVDSSNHCLRFYAIKRPGSEVTPIAATASIFYGGMAQKVRLVWQGD
jgi:hypothetical protein